MQLSNLLEQHQVDLCEVVFTLNSELEHKVALQVQSLIVVAGAVIDDVGEECLEDLEIEIIR